MSDHPRPSALRSILGAFAFLTRVPIATPAAHRVDMASVVRWFPLVGLAVGATVGAVRSLLGELAPATVAAAVAVTAGIAITGAFHEDGLGDTADGFGGGWSPEERLEIMRDSRQGTYGVAAIVCSIVIRVAAVAALAGWVAVAIVGAAHLLARTASGLVLSVGRPARVGSIGESMAGLAPAPALVTAVSWSLLGAALVVAASGPGTAIAMIGAVGVGTVLTVGLAHSKIGGVTGDVLGAIEQVGESAALVAAAAAIGSTTF